MTSTYNPKKSARHLFQRKAHMHWIIADKLMQQGASKGEIVRAILRAKSLARRVRELNSELHRLSGMGMRELKKDEAWEADNVGYIQRASPQVAAKIVRSSVGPDTRSSWSWIRLATGDLVLACYPCGDMYFETESDRSI